MRKKNNLAKKIRWIALALVCGGIYLVNREKVITSGETKKNIVKKKNL